MWAPADEVLAQQQPATDNAPVISGTVFDRSDITLPGANVFVQGQENIGVTTDGEGRYRLVLPQRFVGRTITLTASFIGYKRAQQEVTVEQGTLGLDFSLERSQLSLDELIVAGVSDPIEGDKVPFTVSKVSRANIATVPTTNSALASIQGKVAGVQITRPSGQPGTGVFVEIRSSPTILGDGSPLFVVDGVILGQSFGNTTTDLASLDIESVEVLKGAAATSLYGSRAAAGVIQITTARGSNIGLGETRVEYRTELGASQLPSNRVPTARHHRFLVNDAGEYVDEEGNVVDRTERVAPNDAVAFQDNPFPQLFDNVGALYQPGRLMTHSLTISHNLEDTNFRISGNFYDEKGAVENNNGFQRYNGRLNVDHSISEQLDVGLSVYHNRSVRDDLSGDPFFDLLNYDPDVDLSQRDSTGAYQRFPNGDFTSTPNPIWRQSTRDNNRKTARTLANITGNYYPLEWLRFSGQYSYDRADVRNQIYVPRGVPSGDPGTQDVTQGRLYYGMDEVDTQNANVSARLSEQFGKFNPRLTLTASTERESGIFAATDGTDFAVTGIKDSDVLRDPEVSSSDFSIRTNSYLANLGLDYDGKYIGDFLIRRDGSSLFGPDERWQTYYRSAVAYRVSEEAWWPLKNAVTLFKPRFAIGTAGGRPGYSFQYETFSVSVSSNGESVTFGRGNFGNRALRPEKQTEIDVGLDMALFDRFSAQLSYVRQVNDGQILQAVPYGATGFFSQYANIGQMTATSLEATLEAAIVNRPDMQWSATIVADRVSSEITEFNRPSYPVSRGQIGDESNLYAIWGNRYLTELNELQQQIPEDRLNEFDVNDEGYVVWVGEGNTWRDGIENELWGTTEVIDGVQYEWGYPIFERDEEGIAYQEIGEYTPDLNFGILQNFRYKGLNAHLHLRGQFGGDIYNGTRQSMYRSGRLSHGDVDQAGKPDAEKKPVGYYTNLYNDFGVTNYFIEDATFLKIQALELSYAFNNNQLQRWMGSTAPRSIRFGIIGRNLYTITGYSGFDPDIGSPSDRYDYYDYPNLRSWTGSLQVTF
jgi:TonB-linked SusC/RagA family outer membrane protein